MTNYQSTVKATFCIAREDTICDNFRLFYHYPIVSDNITRSGDWYFADVLFDIIEGTWDVMPLVDGRQ